MPKPDEPTSIEERLQALEGQIQKLERLLRSGRGFTDNSLALSTDLDDLGSVKTYLEFDEVTVPGAPAPEVGRLWAASGGADARPFWTNESAEHQCLVLWGNSTGNHISVIRGIQTVVIANGTREKIETVTHNAGWSASGLVFVTINSSNASAAERPTPAIAYNVTADAFSILVAAHQNVAAARTFTVAWYADGIL